MSQNLSEYLSRRANGNGSSAAVKKQQAEKPEAKVQVNDYDNEVRNNGNGHSGWDSLDIIIQKFDQSKTLPAPLSPILPNVYGGDSLKFEIPRMLSPTLPDIYNNKGKSIESQIRQPVPQRPNRRIHIDDDEDDVDGDDQGTIKQGAGEVEDEEEEEQEEVIPKPPVKRKSFEKHEYFGLHSYKLIETADTKSLELTLHVPSFYKNKKYKSSKPIGLGIRKVSEKTPTVEKVTERNVDQKMKKSSIFKTARDSSPPPPPTTKSNKEVSAKDHSQLNHSKLMAKNEEYLKIAKDKKHKGDELRTKNLKLSLTYFMDSVIIYLVGFNYEDQSRRLLKKLYNDKTWLSLISLIDHALKLSTDNGIVDMAGLCLQIKAVVYEHVCKILDEFIQLNNVKRRKAKTDGEKLKIDETLINHFKNYSKYRELSKRSFVQSERYLSVFKIQKKYPSIVNHYEKQTERNRLAKDTDSLLDPSRDNIHLPINTGVSLKEICAYALKVVKQWSHDEHVKYNDWTFS